MPLGVLASWVGLSLRNPLVQLAPLYVALSLRVLLVAHYGLSISYYPSS